MTKQTQTAPTLALLLAMSLLVPPDVLAQATAPPASGQPAAAGQRAGQVAQVIPAVSIARGTGRLDAAPRIEVQWEDVLRTERDARARIRLDDASVLSVGSESELKVTRHDAAGQRTELELNYGKLRSKVVKLAKPGASFEVRTPVGVAGVVGTDFFLSFENFVATLIVYEGLVRWCTLAGVCVMVNAGMTSTIRQNQQQPDPPQSVPPSQAAAAGQSTQVGATSAGVMGVTGAPHALVWGLVAAVVVPAVLTPVIGNLCKKEIHSSSSSGN